MGLCTKVIISATLLGQSIEESHDMLENLSKSHRVNTPSPRASGGRRPQEAGKADLSKTRLVLAFLIAATSDVISFWTELVPPVQWAVDLVTALLLFILLGRQWALLPGFVAEAIPGVAAFPVWTMVVAAVVLWGRIK
jgi:DNA-binding transcriptional LysR family regulator